MKKNFYKLPVLWHMLFTLLLLLFQRQVTLAQTPQNVPKPSDGVPLSLDNMTNIIFFIVLPLLFIILYIWLRKMKNKSNK